MLESLTLIRFRCHQAWSAHDLPQRVLIAGPNGSGKTSILEAISLISRCRSFRTHRTGECAAWGSGSFGVGGTVQSPVDPVLRLKFEWSRAGRHLAIGSEQNVPPKDFWGKLPTVLFTNYDRLLVQGSGGSRRSWVDSLVALENPGFLQQSQKAVLLQRQKNALLKKVPVDRSLWQILTRQMRPVCASINHARQAFIHSIRPSLEEEYRALTGSSEEVAFRNNRETERRLEKGEDELYTLEERSQNCELGPHREDWEPFLDGKSLRHYGSEGQQKSAALAMRLAEAKRALQVRPGGVCLLLDDILMELDPQRRERFWARCPTEAQWIYSTTDPGRDASFVDFDQPIRTLTKH